LGKRHTGREREKERKKLEKRVIGYIWIYWHVSSEPLEASVLKEGAVGAVGERSPQEKLSHKKMPRAGDLGKAGTVTHR
jgi:hypothetical protein